MKKIIFYICLLFSSVTCFSQSLKGIVIDAETKKPVVNAFEQSVCGIQSFVKKFFKLLSESKLGSSDFSIMTNIPGDMKMSYPQSRWFKTKKDPESKFLFNVMIKPEARNKNGILSIVVITESKNVDDSSNIKTIAGNSNDEKYKSPPSSSSKLYFNVDNFNVDSYGNTNLEKGLFINGDMDYRVGQQLPFDYYPPY